MKMKRIYLASLLIGLFLVSGVQTTKADAATAYPTGLKILVFYDSQDSYSTDYKGLVANYTAAGNTVTVVTETNWNFTVNDTTGYDALFVSVWGSDIFNETTNLQVQSIKTWFDLGSKLLWVGGESDFAGNWIANKTNPLLQALGTNLRFDAGAVGDSVSNDGDGSHRVVANVTGVNSTFVFAVTQGFKEMIFHGATPIYYDMAGVSKDLRNMTLPSTIDVVINTSRFAEAQDQDTSVGNDDYYKYINISAPDYHDINGSFPMLVVDWAAGSSDSVLVLSGERVFSDYKNMYGTIREKSRGLHQGSAVVDAIVNYYFVTMKGGAGVLVHNKYNTLTDTVTNTETETETETEAAITNTETETVITTAAGSVVTETTTETESPVNMIAVFFAISVTALYFRRRK
ncbi:MAG: hypothetical protein IH840_12475 [Candidatus Heimdallarchaeota archaeon]|nr:hypothetical protein [Candidatus Heimdallarchaeota archaeon]